MRTCVLCKTVLEPGNSPDYLIHPEFESCPVKFTDEYGIALDEVNMLAIADNIVESDVDTAGFFEELNIRMFPFVEDVLKEVFAKYGLQRLGGVSTGRGWSVFSTFQRCRYLYRRKYIEPIDVGTIAIPMMEPEARAIGTVVHALLAVYYSRMIIHDYPLTPEKLRDEMIARANPEIVNEGYRVFFAYATFYQGENIMPLAVEFDLRDPRTNESCRFDLIAFFPEAQSDRAPGTYNVEHKTSDRFDDSTLNGWANDGEVLGQMMLWKRTKMHLRFGELKGTIVNILGKQKEPKMHRTTVAPETFQIEQHASDLKQIEAEMHFARAAGIYPRSRANCIGRFGKCDLYDHCGTVNE